MHPVADGEDHLQAVELVSLETDRAPSI
jgi:hypothetical protein